MTRNTGERLDSCWERCLNDYLRSLEIRSTATRISYEGILRYFLASVDPKVVTRREVEDFMHSPSERGKSPAIATMNARLSAISEFFKYASSWIPPGEMEPLYQHANPVVGIIRGKPERSPKGLTPEEMERLFSVIPQTTLIGIRDRAALLLIFWTARRRSEIAGVRYGDIIETYFPDEHGGMRKAYVLAFRGKGHQSQVDHQEIPAPAMDAISWYLLASGRDENIHSDDPLFTAVGREPGKGGNVHKDEIRPLTGSMLAKRVRVYAEQAGVYATLHTLRHTAARARYESGASVRDVQQLLRHSSLATTDLYLRTLIGVEDTTAKLLGSEYENL